MFIDLLQLVSTCFVRDNSCFNLLQLALVETKVASTCFNLLWRRQKLLQHKNGICFNLLQLASTCFNLLQLASGETKVASTQKRDLFQLVSTCFNLLWARQKLLQQKNGICFNLLQLALAETKVVSTCFNLLWRRQKLLQQALANLSKPARKPTLTYGWVAQTLFWGSYRGCKHSLGDFHLFVKICKNTYKHTLRQVVGGVNTCVGESGGGGCWWPANFSPCTNPPHGPNPPTTILGTQLVRFFMIWASSW